MRAYKVEVTTITDHECRCSELYSNMELAKECVKSIITDVHSTYDDVKVIKDFNGTSVSFNVNDGAKIIHVDIYEVKINEEFHEFGYFI